MCKLDFVELGGTLFIPATHKDLNAILFEEKYPTLKSLVIDTEDGLNKESLDEALFQIKTLLTKMQKPAMHIFLRPKNLEVLEVFLNFEGITKITGFVLPKFSLTNADRYLRLLAKTPHLVMPSIEGEELFEPQKLRELKEILLKHKQRVVLVRFGLEDMLKALSMRRSCEESVFDFSATNVVLGNFISIFKSAGFAISGGVYPCYKDKKGFTADVKRDIKEGLFSKTIIHPNQIEPLNELYKVSKVAFDEAQKILKSTDAVFALSEKMAEKTTMHEHSLVIVRRSELYGVGCF